MNIKLSGIALILICLPFFLSAQSMGNANYQQRSINNLRELPQLVKAPNSQELSLSVNAIYNIEASSYVAVFSLTQAGSTIEETDQLMNERIGQIRKEAEALDNNSLNVYVDMISLVPVYEYEVSKKIFSKKTYTEVPRGFEMKKNLHVRYENPEILDRIVSICAKSEVYDLVKVDYFVDNTQAIYDTLRRQSLRLIKEKIAFYEELGLDLSDKKRLISEGDKAFFPVERYASYQAFANYSFEAKDSRTDSKKVNKTTAQYYRPVSTRHYDIVNNPEILEPAIQFTYSLNLNFDLKEEEKAKPDSALAPEPKVEKKVFFLFPNGNMKRLDL